VQQSHICLVFCVQLTLESRACSLAAVGMPPEPLTVAPMRLHMGMTNLVRRGYIVDGQP
jgi:hypothetical protein